MLLLDNLIQLSLLLLLRLHPQQLLLLAKLGRVLRLQLFLLRWQLFQLQGHFLKLLFEAVVGLEQREVGLRATQKMRPELVKFESGYLWRQADVLLIDNVLLHLQRLRQLKDLLIQEKVLLPQFHGFFSLFF